ncbi:DUF433 domain-containing protein [Blastococcus sp. MG754426]|uniref:DUF433 domain-containing protein n=1 Tax=unclassified Blastococcus TaxID=2619396 RepID=UPI001EF0C847|nr:MULTISPECIES: DUF433 domain-containing protein [unclassified Blastococcus]MCF6509518.1 DUF433 domain-containing protein [Blastococcus sp. MG754426]MCF6512156.1 DUF433 domain-containing protein [Blastococcus sp. MG754427]
MSSDRLALITTDPAVLSGQGVIAGTRVPVSVVLDCLAAGKSPEEIVAEYPTLTPEGVQAYGALLAREEPVPLGPSEGQARREHPSFSSPGAHRRRARGSTLSNLPLALRARSSPAPPVPRPLPAA